MSAQEEKPGEPSPRKGYSKDADGGSKKKTVSSLVARSRKGEEERMSGREVPEATNTTGLKGKYISGYAHLARNVLERVRKSQEKRERTLGLDTKKSDYFSHPDSIY